MTTKKAKTHQKLVINNLTVARVDRSIKTIQNWRNALAAAENQINPYRRTLYDIYDEIILDPHLSAIKEKRIANVQANNIVFFDKTGKENDTVTQLISQPFFFKM